MPALLFLWLVACRWESLPVESPRVDGHAETLRDLVEAYYGPERGPFRTSMFLDRDRYVAGDVVRVASWTLDSDGAGAEGSVLHELLCSHGRRVSVSWQPLTDGHAHSELVVPDSLHTGEWTVRVSYERRTAERTIAVRSSAVPRYSVAWEWVEHEGRGNMVRLRVTGPDGSPARLVRALVVPYPDGDISWTQPVQTDAHGVATVSFLWGNPPTTTLAAWFEHDGGIEGSAFALPEVPDVSPPSEVCDLEVQGSTHGVLQVGVECSRSMTVTVAAFMADSVLDAANYEVEPGKETIARLDGEDLGADITVQLFSQDNELLAEQLVPRPLPSQLTVQVSERVDPLGSLLDVAVLDLHGRPVSAALAVSMVAGEPGPRAPPTLESVTRMEWVHTLRGHNPGQLRESGTRYFARTDGLEGREIPFGGSIHLPRDIQHLSGGARGNASEIINYRSTQHDYRHPPPVGDWESQTSVLWQPNLRTDEEGHATLRIPPSSAEGPLYAHVHALAGGRVGGGELLLASGL